MVKVVVDETVCVVVSVAAVVMTAICIPGSVIQLHARVGGRSRTAVLAVAVAVVVDWTLDVDSICVVAVLVVRAVTVLG